MSKIYCAGLFDGEGTVTLGRSSNPKAFRRVEVSVSSTDRVLCDIMIETFRVGYVRFKPSRNIKHKDAYEYRVSGPQALRVLRELRPNMLCPIKQARTDLILTKFEKLTKRNGKYNEAERAAKVAFEEEFFEIAGEASEK